MDAYEMAALVKKGRVLDVTTTGGTDWLGKVVAHSQWCFTFTLESLDGTVQREFDVRDLTNLRVSEYSKV